MVLVPPECGRTGDPGRRDWECPLTRVTHKLLRWQQAGAGSSCSGRDWAGRVRDTDGVCSPIRFWVQCRALRLRGRRPGIACTVGDFSRFGTVDWRPKPQRAPVWRRFFFEPFQVPAISRFSASRCAWHGRRAKPRHATPTRTVFTLLSPVLPGSPRPHCVIPVEATLRGPALRHWVAQ